MAALHALAQANGLFCAQSYDSAACKAEERTDNSEQIKKLAVMLKKQAPPSCS
jgi:hypothetical protein